MLSGQGGGGGGGDCWNEIYCKWEKTPTRDRCSQMETLLNQDKLQMGLDFFFILTENRLKLPPETLLQQSKSTSTHGSKKKKKKDFQEAKMMIARTQTSTHTEKKKNNLTHATQKLLLPA